MRLRYAYALQKRGEPARSKLLVAEAERYARGRIAAGDDTPAQRVELAAAAALRGEADAALEWLEQAFEAGYRDYGFLERDPIFRPLGSHTRLVSVLDRMRRDVEAQRERARTRGLLELQSLIGPGRESRTGRDHLGRAVHSSHVGVLRPFSAPLPRPLDKGRHLTKTEFMSARPRPAFRNLGRGVF